MGEVSSGIGGERRSSRSLPVQSRGNCIVLPCLGHMPLEIERNTYVSQSQISGQIRTCRNYWLCHKMQVVPNRNSALHSNIKMKVPTLHRYNDAGVRTRIYAP